MRNNSSYPKIKNSLIENYKNGKIRYSVFVRSTLNEFKELSKLFYLTEIIENLKEDTGIDIIYNSFWQAYNRYRDKNQIIITKEFLEPSNSVPEFGWESSKEGLKKNECDSFIWLDGIYPSLSQKLKEFIIDNKISEEEFKNLNVNPLDQLSSIRILSNFIKERSNNVNSKKVFT